MGNQTLDGAQALIKTLDDLGIEYVFGYSGGAAIPIFDALETVRNQNEIHPCSPRARSGSHG